MSPCGSGFHVIPPPIPYPKPHSSLYDRVVEKKGLKVLLYTYFPKENLIPVSLLLTGKTFGFLNVDKSLISPLLPLSEKPPFLT